MDGMLLNPDMNVLRLRWKSEERKEKWFNPCLDVSLGAMSQERFWLELINAEYASNREELKVAAIYMIDFKTSSKMTENLLNRGNWKCWIFIDTRCKMPPCIWRITAFKLFLYKSWENDTLIHFFYPSYHTLFARFLLLMSPCLWLNCDKQPSLEMYSPCYSSYVMMFVFLLHSLLLFLQTRD